MAKRKIIPGVQVKMRFRKDLNDLLRDAAKTRGVSLNEEVVDRLVRTFERQGLLVEVLTLAYGEQWGNFLMWFQEEGNLRMSDAAISRLLKHVEKFLKSQIKEPKR
jgi:uncharacterized protein (DUF1778 family)